MRLIASLGVGLLAAPALGQWEAPVPRVPGPVVQAVAREGDQVGSGRIQWIGLQHMNHQGDLAFAAKLDQNGQQRWGLFAWSGGAVTPLALEGQKTGRGPLLFTDPNAAFGEWVWGDRAQALFLGAADANGNGVFDPGVDPQFLFLAERGRIIPLLRVGDRIDGGRLLSILSFQVNGRGQVAFQALIDRDGDGQFTPKVDLAGVYLLDNGRVEPLVREGDRAGDSIVRELDYNLGPYWEFNDRGQALLTGVGLEAPQPDGGLSLILTDRTGTRLLARYGLRTPFGTLYSAPFASLNNHGDVVFSASGFLTKSDHEVIWLLFRVRSDTPGSPLEVLAEPGDLGPDRLPIGGLFEARS